MCCEKSYIHKYGGDEGKKKESIWNCTALKSIEFLENNRINVRDMISDEFEDTFKLAKNSKFSKIIVNCTINNWQIKFFNKNYEENK